MELKNLKHHNGGNAPVCPGAVWHMKEKSGIATAATPPFLSKFLNFKK
ncbi:hypothetical protein [Flavobacterium collinsii]|nr:hypothetical protein [Flavobacterium collinsii]